MRFSRELLVSVPLLLTVAFVARPCSAIIHGDPITDDDALAKHVVALQTEEKQPDGTIKYYKGTGVLVSERIVLTAGHNFYYLPRADSGSAIFSAAPAWGPDSLGQIRIRVKKVEVYPGFKQTASGTENDLALALLYSPAPSGFRALPIAHVGSDSPSAGSVAEVEGYGKSVEFDQDAPASDFRLRKTELSLEGFLGSGFTESPKLWFDQSTKGFCGGDSGAPAIFRDSGRRSVYGVAIHPGLNPQGKMTCLTKGAFTNVVYYQKWISKILKHLGETD